MRWVTYRQTATGRVERALTRYGTLNIPTPKQPMAAPELRKRAGVLRARVRGEAERGEVSVERAAWAGRALAEAAAGLASAEAQRREIARGRRPNVVMRVDCDINTEGLEAYVAGGGGQAAGVRAWGQVEAVVAKAKEVRPGRARLRIEYAYSPMGRGLVEAGHCTGSRVYAVGVDPFKGWTKGLRGAAMHDVGWECDDDAAFVAARGAMVPGGSEVTQKFIEYREEILAKVGDRLFGAHGSEAARREWVKRIFAAYDNDATLEGWAKKTQGEHGGRRVRGMRLWVGEAAGGRGEEFVPEEYWRAQLDSSEWMWRNAGADLREYVTEARPKATARDRMGLWKSYVQQEAEATGREAKVRWARKEGVTVQSIQHDCVVVGRVGPDAGDELEGAALAEAMSRVVTEAVGYKVRVKTKWCEEVGAIVWAD